jgi:hypothetical protein
MLALLGLGLVQAATACALREIDAGRRITAVSAYAEAFERVRRSSARSASLSSCGLC